MSYLNTSGTSYKYISPRIQLEWDPEYCKTIRGRSEVTSPSRWVK